MRMIQILASASAGNVRKLVHLTGKVNSVHELRTVLRCRAAECFNQHFLDSFYPPPDDEVLKGYGEGNFCEVSLPAKLTPNKVFP